MNKAPHGNTGKRNAAKPPQERKAVVHIGINVTNQQAGWVEATASKAGVSKSEVLRRIIINAMQEAE